MNKFINLVVATAYGDAYGLPYETRTYAEIVNLGGPSRHLILPDRYSDFADFKGYPVGTVSDDTQHTVAMVKSLLKKPYDIWGLIDELQLEMSRSDRGWGKGTKSALIRIKSKSSLEQIINNGNPDSNGCGPLMRLAPLALYSYFDIGLPGGGEDFVEVSTRLTHNSELAVVSALVHFQCLKYVIKSSARNLMSFALEQAKLYETKYSAPSVLSDKLSRIATSNRELLADQIYDSTKEAFSSQSVQSLAYACLEANQKAELLELLQLVVAQGGDCDSTAAIAGSMWCLANPENLILPRDVNKLQDYESLKSLSAQFCGAINNLIE
ncbi:ADP-ribosylglycohydrolase family protein [Candidatus Saccharibacteria bacterium]|nr:ADP-ribosylglycohydrolase family protein [Candidatus Saccharibacteria bacterium]MCB9821586.1 ADP-ribosylglycohydrolase family protein [Candidatus Nomurabacteria bacterium]